MLAVSNENRELKELAKALECFNLSLPNKQSSTVFSFAKIPKSRVHPKVRRGNQLAMGMPEVEVSSANDLVYMVDDLADNEEARIEWINDSVWVRVRISPFNNARRVINGDLYVRGYVISGINGRTYVSERMFVTLEGAPFMVPCEVIEYVRKMTHD
ncbi:MAG: hypothetical protein ACTJG2_03970 [Candidatus Saccharimonadales bacterium]